MNLAPPDGFTPITIQNGFALAFGPIWIRKVGEVVSMGFRVDERHVNITNNCHGGALATFADLQLAALQRAGAVDLGHYPTISLSVDYLASAALHDWVELDVTLVKRTRRLFFTQAVLRVASGPVARTTALYSSPSESAARAAPFIAVDHGAEDPPPGFEEIDVGPGFGAHFGPVFGRIDGGQMVLGFRVGEKHANIFGRCHGGAIATFADSQIAALKQSGALGGGHYKTISLSIDYLASARIRDWLDCEVTLVRATRRFAFTQAIISSASGPVARATAIYAMPRNEGAP